MNTTMTDKTWIDLFIVELRMRRVSGAAIGDAVAAVREHLADSGQSAQEAFGPAREYAASLALPAMDPRQSALKTILLPVLGLFAFLIFAMASSAWFAGAAVLLSVLSAVVLVIPVLLVVLFAFPFFPRAVIQQRWLLPVLVVVAGLSGAIAALIAPQSAADAWLVLSPLPVMIATMAVLVVLALIGTITTVRNSDADQIVAPLDAGTRPGGRRGRTAFLLLTDWLFPILAVVVFVISWGMNLVR